MTGSYHCSDAMVAAFELAGMDDTREDLERLADLLQVHEEAAALPSFFGKVGAEYRRSRSFAAPVNINQRRHRHGA